MNLLWLPEALEDVGRLYGFLIDSDAAAAERAVHAVLDGADKLQDHPEMGRPMDDDTSRRELVLPFGAGVYVLRYRIHRGTVVIIRAWHRREVRG
jgi:plasmid stabilization system protein ParE